jgi:hypothetical protein
MDIVYLGDKSRIKLSSLKTKVSGFKVQRFRVAKVLATGLRFLSLVDSLIDQMAK